VRPHQRSREGGVADLDGGQDVAVLPEAVAQLRAAVAEHRVVLRRDGGQPLVRGDEVAAAGQRDDPAVQLEVEPAGLPSGLRPVLLGGRLHPLLDVLQREDPLRERFLVHAGSLLGRVALEQGAEPEVVLELLGGAHDDARTAGGQDLDEPVGREPPERLADGRAAHPELGRPRVLADRFALVELRRDDRTADEVVGALGSGVLPALDHVGRQVSWRHRPGASPSSGVPRGPGARRRPRPAGRCGGSGRRARRRRPIRTPRTSAAGAPPR
jgi:hypothetical protein